MHFNTRDLLITLVPKARQSDPDLEKVCLWHTRICVSPSFCQFLTCLAGASLEPMPCPHASMGFQRGYGTPCNCPHTTIANQCFPVSHEPWVINDREDLLALRTELQEALKQLNDLRTKIPSGIRTPEEKKRVVGALTDALKQVRKARTDD